MHNQTTTEREQIAEAIDNDADGFTLRNDPPKPKHDRGEFYNLERTKQAKLITGLDCLPGQEDLF